MSDTQPVPDEEQFAPDRLFDLMPEKMSPRQRLTLAACLRNPYADYDEITSLFTDTEAEIHSATVENVMIGFEQGTLGQRGVVADDTREMLRKRGGGLADSFDELTEKQQGIVRFLAKYPLAMDELSRSVVAEAIRAIEGVSVSDTYPREVIANYDDLITEYRESMDDDEIPDETVPDLDYDELGRNKSLEQRFRDAGTTRLPDENMDLDGTATLEETPDWVEEYIEDQWWFFDPETDVLKGQVDEPDGEQPTADAELEVEKERDPTPDDSVPDPVDVVQPEASLIGTFDIGAVQSNEQIETDRMRHNAFAESYVDPAEVEQQAYALDELHERVSMLVDMARSEYTRTQSDVAAARLSALETVQSEIEVHRGGEDVE